MALAHEIRLLISDVDGTLVDDQKKLSDRNIEAARRLQAAGIGFTITSARPPRGMAMMFEPLGLALPVAGYSGGVVCETDLTVLQALTLPEEVARVTLEVMAAHGISPWVFVGNDWRITDPHGAHVEHEHYTIGYPATIVDAFTADLDAVAKIMGASDDAEAIGAAEAALREAVGDRAAVARSQAYYVDVTHKDANKGAIVDYFARRLGIDAEAIAVIGDQYNDLAMFRRAGFAIAMGNAPAEVQGEAHATTAGNNEDGFAMAVERYFLGEAR